MPTYEYTCEACGKQFEKFQSITAAPIKKCIHCGKNKARRLISAGAGLIFKGSGFYITDYRSESYKSAAKSDSGASTGKTDAAKSDSAKSDAPKSESATPAPAPATPPAASKTKTSTKSRG